jgi:hypothetical protein
MTKEDFLTTCGQPYDELESLKAKDNFYDYEVGLEHLLNAIGRQYLESAPNEKSVTENRRKKNTDHEIWRYFHRQKPPIHAQ